MIVSVFTNLELGLKYILPVEGAAGKPSFHEPRIRIEILVWGKSKITSVKFSRT